jgi:hypothetical protein
MVFLITTTRLVAKGFAQTYGENYDETFVPVVRKETVRMLFVLQQS